VSGDSFIVNAGAGAQGVNYNFGELLPPAPAVQVQGNPVPVAAQAQGNGVVTKLDSLMAFWESRGITLDVNSM
jgi:hypothetical protein